MCCKSTGYMLMAFVLWGAPESFSVVNMCYEIISKSNHNHKCMICIEHFFIIIHTHTFIHTQIFFILIFIQF